MIHVAVGTKAQLIKLSPVCHALEMEGLPYRLIDTGQHAAIAGRLRKVLRVREPETQIVSEGDIATVGRLLRFAARILGPALLPGDRIRRRVFAGERGVCVVHGDTLSTLLTTLLARRAGLHVAHVEAGLLSRSLLSPFPEEAIRRTVSRMAHLLFAPGPEAAQHLREMGVRGRIIDTVDNTILDAIALVRARISRPEETGHVLATLHRAETILRPARLRAAATVIGHLAETRPVLFVLHPATAVRLRAIGGISLLGRARVLPLQPYDRFLGLVAHAGLVVTDGGSIQEECHYLGIPALVLRDRTERPHMLGPCIRLCPSTPAAVLEAAERVLAAPPPVRVTGAGPSRIVARALAGHADGRRLPAPRTDAVEVA